MVSVIDPDTINNLLTTMLLAGTVGKPYSTGIFETIVAVHFGGLAVEFFDAPKSHIELANGIPNFKKAVIAGWFRAPRTSLEAVANQLAAEQDAAIASGDFATYPFSRLVGYLPLLVFGEMYDGYAIKLDRTTGAYTYTKSSATYSEDGGGYTDPVVTDTVDAFTGRDPYSDGVLPQNPSFIGIRAEWIEDDNGHRTDQLSTTLHVHLQTSNVGIALSAFMEARQTISDSTTLTSHVGDGATTDSAYDPLLISCLTDAVFPGGTETHDHSLADYSNLYINRGGKDSFNGQAAKLVGGEYRTITPDRWHQYTVSFDLTTRPFKPLTAQGRRFVDTFPDCPTPFIEQTITSDDVRRISNPCKMWIAVDDKNYTDVDPLNQGDFVRGIGPNDIATPVTWATAVQQNAITENQKTWSLTGLVRQDTGVSDFDIPTYSFEPDALPSANHPLGVPCVSSLLNPNRHVEMAEFKMWTGISVDTGKTSVRRLFIDKDGNPVKDPKVAIKALGQPVITFHGDGNWIKGKNTGNGGEFTPTGRIIKYRPDPSLHGKQGDPQ